MQSGTPASQLGAVRDALGRLELAVMGLRDAYGDTLGTRRLVSDVRRLADDLDELGEPQPRRRPAAAPALEEIPDTPYDRSMWADAEDEGFGAPGRHAP
jgi:hypothetical protein